MTTTLTPQARRNVVLFSGNEFGGVRGVKKYKKAKEDGTRVLVFEGVPVFRSGTFRDSMGFQHTWESIHMSQMVAHFNLLGEQGIFNDVPVRRGHGGFLGDPIDTLIGYHTGLSIEKRTSPVDDKDYTYLLANFEILDPDAQDKTESGLWRNRSSEVGSFVTNDEAEFWPVYQGFAYVDIPAVEGLNFEKAGVGTKFALMSENQEEAPVAENQGGTGSGQTEATPQGTNQPNAGQTSTEQPNDQPNSGAQTTPPADDEEKAPGTQTTEQQTGTQNPANSEQHGKGGFRVFGKSVTDPTAVQAHIDTLEKFQGEARSAGRKSFVASLVSDKKITAPQEEGYNTLALGMSDEQFSQFKGVWEAAPKLPILESHAGGTINHDGTDEPDAKQDRIDILEGTVKHHRQSGMSDEKIKELPSYQELQALKQKA